MTRDQAALVDMAAYCHGQRTPGQLVVDNRRTVLERNWPLPSGSDVFERRYVHSTASDGALREDVAPQQMCLVVLLAAIAVDRGLLDMERPVSHYVGSRWSRAESSQEVSIVVLLLLEMCSDMADAMRFRSPALAMFARGSESRVPTIELSQRLILVRLGQQAPLADPCEKLAGGLARAMIRGVNR